MRVIVGRAGRPHGIRGEVVIGVRTDEPDLRFAVGSVVDASRSAEDDLPAANVLIQLTDWTTTARGDTYPSLTFKVADLDRAAAHLKSQGVGIRSRTADTLVTDPDTSVNVPWGFTTSLVPGDPRA